MRRVRDNKLTADEWMDRALAAKEGKSEEKKIKASIIKNGFWSAAIFAGATLLSVYF